MLRVAVQALPSAPPAIDEDEVADDLMSMSLTERLTHLAKAGLEKKAAAEAKPAAVSAPANRGKGAQSCIPSEVRI
jgi:hypothetical protein